VNAAGERLGTGTAAGPEAAQAAADRRRTALRRLASGVTVLTVRHGERLHGTTASAVTAVSREPLLISVCLRRGSAFTDLAAAAGRFTVNVLGSRQALLADHFADPARPAGAAQFALVDRHVDAVTGAPELERCLAWLACRVQARSAAGDHEILLGEVLEARPGSGSPLLIYDNRLHGADLLEVARRDPDKTAARGTTIGANR
jgi:flavin reductase